MAEELTVYNLESRAGQLFCYVTVIGTPTAVGSLTWPGIGTVLGALVGLAVASKACTKEIGGAIINKFNSSANNSGGIDGIWSAGRLKEFHRELGRYASVTEGEALDLAAVAYKMASKAHACSPSVNFGTELDRYLSSVRALKKNAAA